MDNTQEVEEVRIPMHPPMIDETIRNKLKAPFPPQAYQKHPTKTFLTTIKAIYIAERLNDVFGIGRWTLVHEIVPCEAGYALVCGELKILDYDCQIPRQYGGHKTGGTNTEPADGYKSAVTDCLSKCASLIEIGLDVFKGQVKPPAGNSPVQQQKPPQQGQAPQQRQAPAASYNTPPPNMQEPPEFDGNQNQQGPPQGQPSPGGVHPEVGVDLSNWNGKVYGRGDTKTVYLGKNNQVTLTEQQFAAIQNHPKYIPQ